MASDDRQETADDIIESMERFASRHWMHDEGQNVREFAARLKAARKREKAAIEADALVVGGIVEAARHTPGNAAAMREALVEAIGETCAGCSRDCDDCMNLKSGWMKKAKAALSAPPRQCDVGTAEEQTTRYRKFCSAHKYLGSDFSYTCKGFGKGRCPFFNSHTKSKCEFEWAQTPYAEEGGAE